jgi:hypothetical protein
MSCFSGVPRMNERARRVLLSHSSPKTGLEWGTQRLLGSASSPGLASWDILSRPFGTLFRADGVYAHRSQVTSCASCSEGVGGGFLGGMSYLIVDGQVFVDLRVLQCGAG